MTRICTENDIAASLQVELSDMPGIVVVEHSSQPEDFSPKFGWDFMAPESARQFHVEIAGEWALVTLNVIENTLMLDVPAHGQATERLARAVSKVMTVISTKARTQDYKMSRNKSDDNFSNLIMAELRK